MSPLATIAVTASKDCALTGLGIDSASLFTSDTDTLLLSKSASDPAPSDLYSSVADTIASIAGVSWTAPVLVAEDTLSGIYLTDEIGVALKPGVDPNEFFANGFSGWYRFFDNQYIATVAAGGGLGSLETANALSADPRVEWASPDFYTDYRTDFTPNDTLFSNQWTLNNTGQTGALNNGSADVNAPAAWDTTQGGNPPTGSFEPRIVVGVLDNGVQLDHPDLPIWINPTEIPVSTFLHLVDVDNDGILTFADLNSAPNVGSGYVTDFNGNGRIDANDLLADNVHWVNGSDDDGNGYIDDLVGWDFAGNSGTVGTNPDNNPNPTTQNDNHGTAVAGIVGALGNNSLGVSGAAENVLIMPIKIARDDLGNGGGFIQADDIAKAVYYAAGIIISGGNPTGATSRAADVLVNSWGGANGSPMETSAWNYIQTHGRNGLGVASFNASGNRAAGITSHLNYETVAFNIPQGNWAFEWRVFEGRLWFGGNRYRVGCKCSIA